MTPGLADAIKNYPQMREDYLAEFVRKQEALVQKAEVPRQGLAEQDDPPATEPPRPYADGSDGIARLKPEHRATRETMEKIRDRGRALGLDHSADLLEHYLKGSGESVNLDKDWVRQHPPIKEGEVKSQKHFEDWLVGKGPPDSQFKTIKEWIPKDNSLVEIKGMYWAGSADNSVLKADDHSNSLGAVTVKGVGDLKLERKGNEVIVTGTVNQSLDDKYDFKKGGIKEWLPQGALGGDFTMTRKQVDEMEQAGGAKMFNVTSDPWTKVLEGRLKLDDKGNISARNSGGRKFRHRIKCGNDIETQSPFLCSRHRLSGGGGSRFPVLVQLVAALRRNTDLSALLRRGPLCGVHRSSDARGQRYFSRLHDALQ